MAVPSQTALYKRGYVTMTADLTHSGHYRALKAFKERCEHLTVGLATDELCVKQKRQPIMSFNQRRANLENCKYVDLVVAHNGERKSVAWHMHKFDVLFSDDQYMHSEEFEIFAKECPNITMIFIPREPGTSSSEIIANLTQRMIESQQVVTVGITGNILRVGFGQPFQILKPIHFASVECRETWGEDVSTSDVFGFYSKFDSLPRNWKSQNHTQQYPMIAGVNSGREIQINVMLKDKPWCTYISHMLQYEDISKLNMKDFDSNNKDEKENLYQFAVRVAQARQFPAKIVLLVQRDAGITFAQWCATLCQTTAQFKRTMTYVEMEIIRDLVAHGIIHGDIHPKNLLVDPKTMQVSLIDFGWVTARCFSLCEKEQKSLQKMLANEFDRTHFLKSMRVCPETNRWVQMLEQEQEQEEQSEKGNDKGKPSLKKARKDAQ